MHIGGISATECLVHRYIAHFLVNIFDFFQICIYLFGVLLFVERDTEFPQPHEEWRWITAEDFRNFFEVGIGGAWTYLRLNQFRNFRFGTGYPERRCSKSCYLCYLELADLFDIVEQVVFFRNNFLVNRTADFRFYNSSCFIRFSSLWLNIHALWISPCPLLLYTRITRSLKSLLCHMRKIAKFSWKSRQLAIIVPINAIFLKKQAWGLSAITSI